MTSLRTRSALTAIVMAGALSLALHPSGVNASPNVAAPSAATEPTSKKQRPGPPPKTTTKQIRNWINEEFKERYSYCNPTFSSPCKLTIQWSDIRWRGTERVCTGWNSFIPYDCLEYNTAYVARTSIMVSTATEYWDHSDAHPGDTYIQTEKEQFGYWSGGRKIVKYQPWPGGPTWSAKCPWGCGGDLHVRKDKSGQWYWGFGNGTWYYLR